MFEPSEKTVLEPNPIIWRATQSCPNVEEWVKARFVPADGWKFRRDDQEIFHEKAK